MSLSANYISELVQTAPDGAVQKVSVIDDHLRMLKRVLQTQFPNLGTAAMTATAAELNQLTGSVALGGPQFKGEKNQPNGYAGLDSGGQIPLSYLPFGDSGFPIGTRLLFQQSSAPTGWLKETDAGAYNNRALRLTTSNTMSGGSVNFDDIFKNWINIPSGTLTGTSPLFGVNPFYESTFPGAGMDGPDLTHIHQTDLDLRVRYIGVIIATKQ